MLVLIGPSASGKTEIAKILIKKYHMKKLITYTTRPIRLGENDGIDYHFVGVNEFIKLKDDNEFIETTFYNNNYYGSRKKDVSFDKVVVLDPNGLNAFYEAMGNKIVSVFMETDESVRIQRMIERKDRSEDIVRRIANDNEVFKKTNIIKIDYIVDNSEVHNLDCLADFIYKLYIKACENY